MSIDELKQAIRTAETFLDMLLLVAHEGFYLGEFGDEVPGVVSIEPGFATQTHIRSPKVHKIHGAANAEVDREAAKMARALNGIVGRHYRRLQRSAPEEPQLVTCESCRKLEECEAGLKNMKLAARCGAYYKINSGS